MAATDLVTIDEAKLWLNEPDGVDKDGVINQIITQSSALITRYLGRDTFIQSADVTEYHPREDGQWIGSALYALDWPIQSVTSIHEDTNREYGSDTLLVANTDYIVSGLAGKIIRIWGATSTPRSWETTFRAIKVIYKPGYAATDNVPREIKDVCGRHVSSVYSEITKQVGNMANVSEDFGSFTRYGPALLTSGMKSDLAPFRRVEWSQTGERDS